MENSTVQAATASEVEMIGRIVGRAMHTKPTDEPAWLKDIRRKYSRKLGQPLIQMNGAGELSVTVGYAEVRGMFMAEKEIFISVSDKSPDEIWDEVRESAKAIKAEYAASQEQEAN